VKTLSCCWKLPGQIQRITCPLTSAPEHLYLRHNKTLPSDIRVALIGYGFVGKTFHVPLIEATPGLRLAVVASRQKEVVLSELPAVEVTDPQTALAHENVDLVVIASPNDSHFSLARAALHAGKHVVVDKPFTTTVAEAQELSALAEAQDCLLSVFHNRRWDSDFLTVRTIIEQGLLGEVVHFESHMDRFRPEIRDRWRERPGPGSGLWFDLGPHLIDQALQLFGMPQNIAATLANQRAGAQTDDWAHVLLDYGSCKVILHGSLLAASGSPRFTVHGVRGSLIKRLPDPQESQLRAGMRPNDPRWGMDPDCASFFDGQGGPPQQIESQRGDYRQYYRAIVLALNTGSPNPVAPKDAINVMTVLEAAMRSSVTGTTISFPTT
jgi:predicted dehydrogenase